MMPIHQGVSSRPFSRSIYGSLYQLSHSFRPIYKKKRTPRCQKSNENTPSITWRPETAMDPTRTWPLAWWIRNSQLRAQRCTRSCRLLIWVTSVPKTSWWSSTTRTWRRYYRSRSCCLWDWILSCKGCLLPRTRNLPRLICRTFFKSNLLKAWARYWHRWRNFTPKNRRISHVLKLMKWCFRGLFMVRMSVWKTIKTTMRCK